ncbi:MAG: maleylpyruvate isomerase family mycothiol-dependent enzyme [Chloroflexi bacterium]|nr:maleylpyruvate isomerase family mycothiol-dependent enzyme [Chloroflexota bacterium]
MVSGPTAPNMEETIALLRSESDALAEFLAGLEDEGWARQSACDAWTVADAAAHIAQGSQGSSNAITRAQNDNPAPPEGQRLLDAGDRASEPTAERAIAFSTGKQASELLQAYREGADLLVQTAEGLRPGDWEKPSFHRRGIIPIHENVTRRIQEIAIHGWDIRSAFDPASEISEAGAQEIATVAHRWLGVCFVPLEGGANARFRFDVSGPAAFQEDVVLEGDGFRIEPAGDAVPDVTFRANTSAYVLLVYGRLDISSGSTPVQLEIDGPLEKALLFTRSFQGY